MIARAWLFLVAGSLFLRGSSSSGLSRRGRLLLRLRSHALWQLLAPRFAIPFLERLVRDLPLHEELCKLPSLCLALEWHECFTE